MSLLSTLRNRARDVISTVRPGRAPAVAANSAAPVPSRLGTFAWSAGSRGPDGSTIPAAWDRDPDTGAVLPTGAPPSAGPAEWPSARIAHRHGWFAALGHAHTQGDTSAAATAIAGMEAWLRQDVPGTGLAWAHATDLAARLIHWNAGLAWLGPAAPPSLVSAMAGSAVWHLDHLDARAPQSEADALRRVIHHAGRVVGGFTFIDLEGARDAWSEGIAGLREDLSGLTFGDGSPRDGAPLALAEALWFVAIARATARANGASFPPDADAALARGTHFIERLTCGVGALPPIGERFVGSVVETPYPLGWSLRNLLVAWGIESGDAAPRPAEDARSAWLSGATLPEPTAPLGKSWAVWVWREGGWGLAEMRIKNRAARLVAWLGRTGRGSPLTHPAPLSFTFDLGDIPILADPGPSLDNPEVADAVGAIAAHSVLLLDGRAPPAGTDATFDLGRVDGKKARFDGHHDGFLKLGIPLTHKRKLLLNQARLTVTDILTATKAKPGRHAVQIAWQFGPGWAIEKDEKGWTAKNGPITVVLQLSDALSWSIVSGQRHPAALGWVKGVAAPCLLGSGGIEGDAKFESSFEIR